MSGTGAAARWGVGTARQGPYAPVAPPGGCRHLDPRAPIGLGGRNVGTARLCDLGGRAWRFPHRSVQRGLGRCAGLPVVGDHDPPAGSVSSSRMTSTALCRRDRGHCHTTSCSDPSTRKNPVERRTHLVPAGRAPGRTMPRNPAVVPASVGPRPSIGSSGREPCQDPGDLGAGAVGPLQQLDWRSRPTQPHRPRKDVLEPDDRLVQHVALRPRPGRQSVDISVHLRREGDLLDQFPYSFHAMMQARAFC